VLLQEEVEEKELKEEGGRGRTRRGRKKNSAHLAIGLILKTLQRLQRDLSLVFAIVIDLLFVDSCTKSDFTNVFGLH
jgi:hypothetical protein